MLEIESTFLAQTIPEGFLDDKKSFEIIDNFFPKDNPTLRLRKKGEKYELVKKQQLVEGDASAHKEHTIPLTKKEYDLFALIPSLQVRKLRYALNYEGYTYEVDVFSGVLQGLVVIEVEFDGPESQANYVKPKFIGADITQEDFIAGKNLAGKSYSDIKHELERFNYTPITVGNQNQANRLWLN